MEQATLLLKTIKDEQAALLSANSDLSSKVEELKEQIV